MQKESYRQKVVRLAGRRAKAGISRVLGVRSPSVCLYITACAWVYHRVGAYARSHIRGSAYVEVLRGRTRERVESFHTLAQ